MLIVNEAESRTNAPRREQWLADAHANLDAAFAAAYGWLRNVSGDEAPPEFLAPDSATFKPK